MIFFVNPLNPLKEDVEGLQLNKADLVSGKVPADQLPSYVDDVVNIEHFSSTEPVALEDELWYDTVNHDLSVYDGEAWIAVDIDYGRIYVNVDTTSDSYNSTFRYNGVSLILLGANVTRTFLEGILQTRTVAIPAYDIDMALGEDFTKTCAAASVFTISNPIIKKAFRLFITGGTLGTPLFTGYTSNWILGALPIDYNPAIENILICEIRSAGQIYLFWGNNMKHGEYHKAVAARVNILNNTIPVTGVDTIPLPVTAAQGTGMQVQLFGQSASEEISTSSLLSAQSALSVVKTTGKPIYTAIVTINAVTVFGFESSMPVVVGEKYYARLKVKLVTGTYTVIDLLLRGSTSSTQSIILQTINSPVLNTQYTLSGIGTLTSNLTGLIRFISRAWTPIIGDVIEYVEPVFINLTTTFGAGNEPTKGTMRFIICQLF